MNDMNGDTILNPGAGEALRGSQSPVEREQ
jgi:hypothetical protein